MTSEAPPLVQQPVPKPATPMLEPKLAMSSSVPTPSFSPSYSDTTTTSPSSSDIPPTTNVSNSSHSFKQNPTPTSPKPDSSSSENIIPLSPSTKTTTTVTSSNPRPIPVTTSKPTHVTDQFSTSPSVSSSVNASSYSSSIQSPIESLRRHPTDLTTPIPEECDEETCSESFPNEPVTPISGRQSRDFRVVENNELLNHRDSGSNGSVAASHGPPEHADVSLNPTDKDYLEASLAPTTLAFRPQSPTAQTPRAPLKLAIGDFTTPTKPVATNTEQNPLSPATSRPPSRRSSSVLSRTMSSIFRRSNSHLLDNGASSSTPTFKEPSYSTGTSETNLAAVGKTNSSANMTRRRFSYHRSVATTRSNSPPSPGSPLEMALPPNGKTGDAQMPTSNDFFDNNAKKNRAHTGLSLRQRINFVGGLKDHTPRRTKSLERKKKAEPAHLPSNLTGNPWAIAPEAGAGVKARRLSLSLPDDFFVDVAELLKEFEYQHKLLGRHGKHLGKGATSKVTLMVRKGCPGELYAVKEFRSKGSSETAEEYEKKIKSEYSIAKSLHHPNIVETIRLCNDHGRWNHVMEYCSEGDLFNLVSKKHLLPENRDSDRLCLFKQLCQGINYLHSHGVAHRDIKLENLLITKDSKLKITDFGVSEVFTGIHPGLREAGGQCGINMGDIRLCKPAICGSLPYIAPEVLNKKEDYDPRALDVWSSAVVMIYLIFGANLWEKAEPGLNSPSQKWYNDLTSGWDRIEVKRAADPEGHAKDLYPKLEPFEWAVKPVALRRLLLNMLHPNPNKRPKMNDVVSGRWMKGVECCQPETYDDPVKFIDASKKGSVKGCMGRLFCHNHLPPVATSHGLPPMPGKAGY